MLPRKRSENRDRAFEIYVEHGGNITNREIANLLEEDEKVVAVWKSRDKWNVVQQSKNSCTTNKKGGQPGNKNATGPPGNKNAVKTGEFETLFFDALDPEEQRLVDALPTSKEKLLLQEIQLLTVRERRMMHRIEAVKDATEQEDDGTSIEGMTLVKRQSGMEKDKETDLKEYHGKLGQIQAIEDALTRVQARKQKAIDSLHRFGFDDARLEIELMRLDLASLKIGGQDNEIADDGFLDALNAEAGSLWSDGDGD